jgi:glycosyltransferase XagB
MERPPSSPARMRTAHSRHGRALSRNKEHALTFQRSETPSKPGEEALIALFLSIGITTCQINAARRDGAGASFDWADRLMAEGVVSEADVLSALATRIGAAFTHAPPPPATPFRADEAFSRRQYHACAVGKGGRKPCIMAPDARGMARLLAPTARLPGETLLLTTSQAFLDAVIKADAARIVKRAATTLPPLLSARHTEPFRDLFAKRIMPSLLALLLVVNIILYGFGPILLLVPMLLSPVFMVASLSVLWASWVSMKPQPPDPPLQPADLPRYSVIIPLYQEKEIVPLLVERMASLSYPREKLEIFFLIEEVDHATRAAFAAITLPPYMFTLVVPKGKPQTKPRALNVALPFLRGEYVVVFDAEDAPEADQLLKAAAKFAGNPIRTACIQARIAISNVRDGFLTSRFAIEYAALFDCIKAGAARLGWPVPLGGTSNHFRVSTLRSIGGWDAWNVTEDADLGLRLARFGWRVADLPSTTWEEAPNTLASWLNQRTRWLKGWFQTLSVHTRSPKRAIRQFGYLHTLVITSMGVAFLVGALFQPFFVLALTLRFLSDLPLFGADWLIDLADGIIVLSLALALLAEVVPALLALYKRKGWWLFPLILLAPVSHVLIFVAAWRGLREWVTNPFHWHKTRHGVARSEGGLAMLDSCPPSSDAPVKSTEPKRQTPSP